MPLSEHVYCVVITFKMNEQVEQQICIKLCVKLEHFSVETIWMIQKAAAMGNWWLAALLWQPTCSLITSQAEFLAKHQITQVTQPPLQPRFGALRLLSFSKTKITFEWEDISDHWWDSGKYDGVADGYWQNCVRSQGAYFEGDWGVIVLCKMFLVSSLINIFIFHSTWLDTFWIDPIFLFLVCIYKMKKKVIHMILKSIHQISIQRDMGINKIQFCGQSTRGLSKDFNHQGRHLERNSSKFT